MRAPVIPVSNPAWSYLINFYASLRFACFSSGRVLALLSVDLGGPPQCLNSGPGLEPGVNRGLGSLFCGYASNPPNSVPFFVVSGRFPLVHLKTQYCPAEHLLWGYPSAFYDTGSPSLFWSLASSRAGGILTWFRQTCPLKFLRRLAMFIVSSLSSRT